MKSPKTIKLSTRLVRRILDDLSVIVVSWDHMGSTDFKNKMEDLLELEKFAPEIFKRAARSRDILSKAFNSQVPNQNVLRYENRAENLPYWTYSKYKRRKLGSPKAVISVK